MTININETIRNNDPKAVGPIYYGKSGIRTFAKVNSIDEKEYFRKEMALFLLLVQEELWPVHNSKSKTQ